MNYKKIEAKQWARENLPGIGGGIIQPLNDDYSIDYEGLKGWINRQIEMGKGVFPLTAFKYWAEQLGLAGGPVRPPFDLLDDFTKRTIDTRLREAGLVSRVDNNVNP